eukprot:IDg13674t1
MAEEFFGEHVSSLSETFREGLERMLAIRGDLIVGHISPAFIAERVERYARAVM